MPSLILTLLTAASLLAHSVLGCCWHHAHGCDSSGAVMAEAEHSHGHHDACESSSHETAELGGCLISEDPESHEHGLACDEPDCSFVKSQPSAMPSLDVHSTPLVALPLVTTGSPVRYAAAADTDAGCRSSGAALRAVLQVWLV
jgi:hypothetical protein